MSDSRKKKKTWFGVSIPVALFFIGILLPPNVSVTAGGLRFSAYRAVLIVLFLPMFFKLLSGKAGKFTIFDGLVIGHSFWATLALIKWGGFAQGVESGGIYVIEFMGAYLMGRLYIRNYEDFAAFANFYVGVVVGMLVFTIPEALTEWHILRDTAAQLLGGPRAPYIDKRMGIERAFGPFDHPILYGVFSASAFSLAYFIVAERSFKNKKGMAKTLGVVVATFISGSGGPYVVLAMQMFVAGWERVLTGVQGRWKALFGFFAMAYLWIDLMSNRTPFHVFVTYFTFSTQSAYNRINIWNYGTAEVARHPIFGIGLGDWVRPVWMSDSMDNFWLLIAVRYGLPAWFMLFGLMIGMVIVAASKKNMPEKFNNARRAWGFTLFGITVAAATVHLWNSLFVLFMFLIGSGAWMAEAKSMRRGEAKRLEQGGGDKPLPKKPRRRRHSFF